MEENTTETETRNPLKQAIIIGVVLITIASIVRLVRQWVSYPDDVTSAGDFLRLLIDSFKYILNSILSCGGYFYLLYISSPGGIKRVILLNFTNK